MSKMLTLEYVLNAISNPLQNQKCCDLHPDITCNQKFLAQFMSGCKSLSKMYLLVHLIPFLLFKRKKAKQNPRRQLTKLVVGFLKSMLFAGGYSAMVRRGICLWTQLYKYQGDCGVLVAIVAGITLIFQPIGRQSEIALFCLNKSMETSYNCLIRRKYSVHLPFGQGILGAVALAIISYHYINNSQSIRQNYRKILDKLLGNC